MHLIHVMKRRRLKLLMTRVIQLVIIRVAKNIKIIRRPIVKPITKEENRRNEKVNNQTALITVVVVGGGVVVVHLLV